MTKVFIVGGCCGSYRNMYIQAGFEIADNLEDADLVQFTGGSDVDPSMYDQKHCKRTHSYVDRDIKEAVYFNKAIEAGKPMVGICRGGQFLNVMNGGEMFQDVDNHALSTTHSMDCLLTKKTLQVSSTHHQMMLPSKDALIVSVAKGSTYRELWPKTKAEPLVLKAPYRKISHDIEVLYYEKTNCLCYQPHPEIMTADSDCRKHFFELVNNLLGVK